MALLTLNCFSKPMPIQAIDSIFDFQMTMLQTLLQKHSLVGLLCVVFLFTGYPLCLANEEEETKDVDKNGVSPNTIKLPQGPGSIKGLGDSFKPQLNTGSAQYAVNIPLPAGVAGHTPELVLKYDSGQGDGPLGIGWSFGPVPISRQTDKGIPLYIDADNNIDDNQDGQIDEIQERDTFLDPAREELVPLDEDNDGAIDSYRAQIESSFTRYLYHDQLFWQAQLKDGSRQIYGRSSSARVTDVSDTHVFQWLLEISEDTNGNQILYTYKAFNESTNQRYLSEIRYGPGAFPWNAFYFVKFNYAPKPDWRQDFRSGFSIITSRRLKSIVIGVAGVPQPDQCVSFDLNENDNPNDDNNTWLICRFELAYNDDNPICSYLSGIKHIGSDGITSVPPDTETLSFTYTTYQPAQSIPATKALITSYNTPYLVMDHPSVDLVDLDSDSLPDILKTDSANGIHTVYTNLGQQASGDGQIIKWAAPQQVVTSDSAAQFDLAMKSVYLADMDGNGRADLVYTNPWHEVCFHPNQGSNTWGCRQWMTILDYGPPSPFADQSAKTSDLDNDKRIDVLKSDANGYSVWLNLGPGQYSRPRRTSGAVYNDQVLQLSESSVHLADMNGDQLADIVKITPSSLIICAGMGHGRFDTAVIVPIPEQTLSSGPNSQIQHAGFHDINDDGLADLVIERATINQLWYWLNLGTYRLSHWHVICDMPSLYNPDTAVRWADMNGNGTTDLIYADSSADDKLVMLDIGELIGGYDHPNLLKTIDNHRGAVTTIQYTSSTQLYLLAQTLSPEEQWQTTLPFPVHVVTGVINEVQTLSQPEVYQTRYNYFDGYYDEVEKDFWGFARECTYEPGDESASDVITTSWFHTGQVSVTETQECLKGKLLGLELADGSGKIYQCDTNTWEARILANGVDGRKISFASNTSALNTIYEGTLYPKQIYKEFDCDNYGNLIHEFNFGIVDPNYANTDDSYYTAYHDELLKETQYINDTENWILGYPSQQTITDYAGTVQADQKIYYDDLPYGQIVKGNLTCQEDWLDKDSLTGQSNCWIPTLRNRYDQYGNIIRITNANDHYRSLTYDNFFHAWPISEIIHREDGPELTLNVSWHYGFGQIDWSSSFSQVESTCRYDCFGRVKAIDLPGGAQSTFQYHIACPVSHILTQIKENAAGDTFDSYAYFDSLYRELGSKIEAENNQWRFVDAVSFNQRMLVYRKWQPVFAYTRDYEQPDDTDPNFIAFQYDARDRVVCVTNPDKTYTQTIFEPLIEHQYDENDTAGKNTPKSLIYNGLERLIEVVERNADDTTKPEYHTRYQWTTLGGLTQITDALNNIKTIQYDSLRRKTFTNDPDRGHMYYGYDPVGHLRWTKDAKNQQIVYAYDQAERLLTENYLDQTGDLATDPVDVAYYYDISQSNLDFGDTTSGTAQNTLGRLAWVRDLSGQEHFSYDQRGNIAWSVKRIIDPKTAYLTSYKSSFQYDIMDRLKTVTYPDNDCVEYCYNEASQTESIFGPGDGGKTILSKIDYEPTGQLKLMAFGNGIDTGYSYDNRNRLQRLKTVKSDKTELIHYYYHYDPVSNINRITDLRPYTQVAKDLPRRNTQVFQYDDLYRLTQVRYARQDDPEANYGQIDYSYDSIGNMLGKTSPAQGLPGHIDDDDNVNLGTFVYAGGTQNRVGRNPGVLPGPHALTATANGGVYDYDANGNMTNIEGAQCAWDFQDRLIRYEKDDTVARYSYDYTGRRITKKVIKGNTATQTLYPNRVFEIRPNCAPVKYVFNGQSRIARVKGTLSPETSNERVQRIWLYQGMNLISFAVQTDVTIGEIFQDDKVYSYNGTTYQPVSPMSILQSGEPLWVDSDSDKVLSVKGIYNDSVFSRVILPDDTLVSWPRLEPFYPSVHIESDFRIWAYDNFYHDWMMLDTLLPTYLSNVPSQLETSCAFWLKQTQNINISSEPTRSNDIVYYHNDHLGSSNVITDTYGNLIEETNSYPFGTLRNSYSVQNIFNSCYRFTGKELDAESQLQYFEARYLIPKVGRFASVDLLFAHNPIIGSKNKLADTINLNTYSYVHNSPLVFIDSDGHEAIITYVGIVAIISVVDKFIGVSKIAGNMALKPLASKNIEQARLNLFRSKRDVNRANFKISRLNNEIALINKEIRQTYDWYSKSKIGNKDEIMLGELKRLFERHINAHKEKYTWLEYRHRRYKSMKNDLNNLLKVLEDNDKLSNEIIDEIKGLGTGFVKGKALKQMGDIGKAIEAWDSGITAGKRMNEIIGNE